MNNDLKTDNAQLRVVLGVRASGKSTAAQELVHSHGIIVCPKWRLVPYIYPNIKSKYATSTDTPKWEKALVGQSLVIFDEIDLPISYLVGSIVNILQHNRSVVVFHTPGYAWSEYYATRYTSDEGMSEALISLVYQVPFSSSLHLWTQSYKEDLNKEQTYEAWFRGASR